MSTANTNDQWFVSWVMTAAVGLLYAMFGAVWLHIGQSKREAIDAAQDVRRELLAGAETDRTDRATRAREHREDLDRIWTELRTNQRAGLEQHQRMLDQLASAVERLGHMPTREEMKADGSEREARIMAAFPARSAK